MTKEKIILEKNSKQPWIIRKRGITNKYILVSSDITVSRYTIWKKWNHEPTKKQIHDYLKKRNVGFEAYLGKLVGFEYGFSVPTKYSKYDLIKQYGVASEDGIDEKSSRLYKMFSSTYRY